ncbi:EPIDERMAL PATTERNING FACTOR-like protein 4 [Dendrobium catenatum]|uniref:Epidermal patterning factor-like protein n=1 Tax=Dendrobium catenatum TaxID=906689 RepID=A0A2I0WUR5_9ASPA|nr:EPIDERMAL PATTERNING FACTOR-like protein 4 [Dendrobium catenatum]
MEVRNRHGCALSAALALILLFVMAMSTGLLEILQQKEESRFLRPSVLKDEQWQLWAADGRRRLAGPGSSPPICRSRCGDCFPCRPIHVTIQQGQSIPLEYYPEAWRCKCRDKFFIP